MIDVVIVLLSMFLQVLMNPWDRTWTPTFQGTRTERFIAAMHHYQEKMGIEEQLVFSIRPTNPLYSAWVSPINRNEVLIGFAEDSKEKPEYLALHEACHVRMKHHLLSVKNKHKEIKKCERWYSAKERR